MKNQTFEEFLEEYWFSNVAEGQSKEASIAATERWIGFLDASEFIELADKFADSREMQVRKELETI